MKHWFMAMTLKRKFNRLNGRILFQENQEKKARQVPSNVKVLLTVFFYYNGIVYHEFLPLVDTVNKEYYIAVMCHLRESIRKKSTRIVDKQPVVFASGYRYGHTFL